MFALLHEQYSGRFLTGRYDLESSGINGVKFEPRNMASHDGISLQDQQVVLDLQKADDARRSVAQDITAGFGRVRTHSS